MNIEMNTEVAGFDLREKRSLTVVIGRKHINVDSLQAAQGEYMDYIAALEDDGVCGASVTPQCKVFEGKEQVARVSYNGRVWKK